MKNTFLTNRSRLGLLATVSFFAYFLLIYLGVIAEKGVTLIVFGPAGIFYFLVMGYSGCDIKGGLNSTCQIWSAPVLGVGLLLQAICVYFVFALIERAIPGPCVRH